MKIDVLMQFNFHMMCFHTTPSIPFERDHYVQYCSKVTQAKFDKFRSSLTKIDKISHVSNLLRKFDNSFVLFFMKIRCLRNFTEKI